ncbi:hypothetical protein [Sphingopyxis sp. 550A]|jgi:hypothetical protein
MTDKPQGKDGPVEMGAAGAEWLVTKFPADKAEREQLVADLFVKGFERWVAGESEPSLKPFGPPKQNAENDLDFTISTGLGDKLMELAEFAPLAEHGPKFEAAPESLPPQEKGKLAAALVEKKSGHQGGENRFLLLYVTEQGFWLDPFAIEWVRRLLTAKPPKFERVYYVSIHGLTDASVSEIYPGQPNRHCIGMTDEQLAGMNVRLPHPRELIRAKGIVRLRPDKA